MSNHYHVVLRIDRDAARQWSEDEVIARWSQLFCIPLVVERLGSAERISEAERAKALEIVEIWRTRLHDVSWFMRCLTEHLARRANAEDQCKGRFWERRFKSQALLDEAGLLTCMSYVDFNPIRACIASMPEDSEYTSIYTWISSMATTTSGSNQKDATDDRDPNRPILLPFRSPPYAKSTALPFYLTDYLDLVDWTGRAIRDDKRGYIPGSLPPILYRLGIDPDHWLKQIQRKNDHFSRAIGRIHTLAAHAQGIGQQWIKGMQLSRRLYADITG